MGEDTTMKQAQISDVREVELEVNLCTTGDKTQEEHHLDIDLCINNGMDSFKQVLLWIHKEIAGIQTKKAQEVGKIETLQALGLGKFNSLPDCLSELTKSIGNA